MLERADLRWGYGEQGLRKMCDHGADQVRAGNFDAVEFSVMGDEREAVRAYMREKHPTVPYRMTYPAGKKPDA